MEETLKWILPIFIPLIISLSTAIISSKNTIRKTKEETAKEIARVNAETLKELEIIKAQTEKEIALFKVQQEAKKENAKDDMVNQTGSQFMTTLLTSSMQGKNPTEMIESLKQLQNLADELKK